MSLLIDETVAGAPARGDAAPLLEVANLRVSFGSATPPRWWTASPSPGTG